MIYFRNSKSGFTLIELLVVIAIISILAAILFPVFAKVREKARQTSCASNEKQLGLAFQQYVNDYDETYPISAEPHASSIYGYGWAGRLFPYVKSTGIYQCPDDSTSPTTAVVGATTYTMSPVSYAYNGSITSTNIIGALGYGNGVDGKASALNSPTKTVLLLEVGGNSTVSDVTDLSTPDEIGSNGTQYSSGFNYTYALNGGARMPLATGYLSNGAYTRGASYTPTYYQTPDGRHTGGANYLLADGHVKWLRGASVSTGQIVVGNAPCATLETNKQDPSTSCRPFSAGTGSSEGWAATWSPI